MPQPITIQVDAAQLHNILQAAQAHAHNLEDDGGTWARATSARLLENIPPLRARIEQAEAEALTQ